jgi:hypothetical protein
MNDISVSTIGELISDVKKNRTLHDIFGTRNNNKSLNDFSDFLENAYLESMNKRLTRQLIEQEYREKNLRHKNTLELNVSNFFITRMVFGAKNEN